jgi:hypothetical protein
MAGLRQRLQLVVLLIVAAVMTTGCNIMSLPYFLMMGSDLKPPPADTALADQGKEIKAVVLAYCNGEMRPEFVGVERDLASALTRSLEKLCKDNKDKVTLIQPGKVQTFKNKNPDWQTMKLDEIGKQLGADKVIYLGIDSLTLYEKGSANQLYHGRAEISVYLAKVNDPDQFPTENHFTCEYPSSRGPISVDDQNAREFYLAFVNYMAKRMSWYFTAHAIDDDITCD